MNKFNMTIYTTTILLFAIVLLTIFLIQLIKKRFILPITFLPTSNKMYIKVLQYLITLVFIIINVKIFTFILYELDLFYLVPFAVTLIAYINIYINYACLGKTPINREHIRQLTLVFLLSFMLCIVKHYILDVYDITMLDLFYIAFIFPNNIHLVDSLPLGGTPDCINKIPIDKGHNGNINKMDNGKSFTWFDPSTFKWINVRESIESPDPHPIKSSKFEDISEDSAEQSLKNERYVNIRARDIIKEISNHEKLSAKSHTTGWSKHIAEGIHQLTHLANMPDSKLHKDVLEDIENLNKKFDASHRHGRHECSTTMMNSETNLKERFVTEHIKKLPGYKKPGLWQK